MRILIADDRDQVRFGLRVLLEHQPGYQVVGQARCVEDLVAQVEALHPDLVLADWELPSGPDTSLAAVLPRFPETLTVIALSGRPEARRHALAAGVGAFVSKGDPPERLLVAIRDCCQAERVPRP
jgi:DNA-binding NarL/FixJ family response regulator